VNLYWLELGHSRLAIVGRPRGDDWLEDDVRSLKEIGVDILVSALTASEWEDLGLMKEESACRSCGIEFVSFPIEDRSVPASVHEFGKLIDRLHALLAADKHLAVHCRAGIGRSSLIAAALLIENGFSVEAAFAAVERARGVQVPDTDEQRRWIEDWSKSK